MRCPARRFALLVAAVALATGGGARAQSLEGTWSGTAHEIMGAQFGSDYAVEVEFHPSGDATVRYPELACSGHLQYRGRAGEGWKYLETITQGRDRCANGYAYFYPEVDGLLWVWSNGRQLNSAAAMLRQSAPIQR